MAVAIMECKRRFDVVNLGGASSGHTKHFLQASSKIDCSQLESVFLFRTDCLSLLKAAIIQAMLDSPRVRLLRLQYGYCMKDG